MIRKEEGCRRSSISKPARLAASWACHKVKLKLSRTSPGAARFASTAVPSLCPSVQTRFSQLVVFASRFPSPEVTFCTHRSAQFSTTKAVLVRIGHWRARRARTLAPSLGATVAVAVATVTGEAAVPRSSLLPPRPPPHVPASRPWRRLYFLSWGRRAPRGAPACAADEPEAPKGRRSSRRWRSNGSGGGGARCGGWARPSKAPSAPIGRGSRAWSAWRASPRPAPPPAAGDRRAEPPPRLPPRLRPRPPTASLSPRAASAGAKGASRLGEPSAALIGGHRPLSLVAGGGKRRARL